MDLFTNIERFIVFVWTEVQRQCDFVQLIWEYNHRVGICEPVGLYLDESATYERDIASSFVECFSIVQILEHFVVKKKKKNQI